MRQLCLTRMSFFSHSDELLDQVDDFELSKFAIIYVVFFSRLAVHRYTDTVPSFNLT